MRVTIILFIKGQGTEAAENKKLCDRVKELYERRSQTRRMEGKYRYTVEYIIERWRQNATTMYIVRTIWRLIVTLAASSRLLLLLLLLSATNPAVSRESFPREQDHLLLIGDQETIGALR